MTQKEYKEEIEKYKVKIEKLQAENADINFKNYEYERILADYHRVSADLEKERIANTNNVWVIEEQRKLIQKYEAIINRVTLSSGERNNDNNGMF